MRIKAYPGSCVGSGTSRHLASSVYQLDDEGYLELHPLQAPPDLESDAVPGANACPARAISVLFDVPIQHPWTEGQQ